IGQNIFNWLKERITEKPYVLYLLSPEYYSSVACLNEMGAAWIVENQHAMIFTPNFNLSSYEFQNGALDPREIGFYINDEDRLFSFIESLKSLFSISSNQVLINQKCKEFFKQINLIDVSNQKGKSTAIVKDALKVDIIEERVPTHEIKKKIEITKPQNLQKNIDKFIEDFENNKLKDEEILLLQYANDTARYKLGTGWQESIEIDNIK